MSETDSAGASDAGGSIDSASAAVVQDFKDRAFEAIAHSKEEDASDYVAERKDRDAEAAGDPEVHTPARKQLRAERFQRALEAAEGVADDGRRSEHPLSQAHQDAVSAASDVDGRAREHETIRATAQHEMRVADFVKRVPDYHDWVQAILPVFPPSEDVALALLRSPHGPQLTYELANNIDALEQLNAMSPHQAQQWISRWEGVLDERTSRQASSPPPVRTTRAPKPLTKLSGGASAPSDMDAIIKSEDASAYIAKRRAGWNG